MKPACIFRSIGILWLLSLVAFLFLELLDFAGGPPVWQGPVCAALAVVWVVSGLSLAVWYACSLRRPGTDIPDTIRSAMPRWLAAVAGGLLGGLAACLANHLFPGAFTLRNKWAAESLLMALLGVPIGSIALAFSPSPRKAFLVALPLSAAVSWWIVTWNFR